MRLLLKRLRVLPDGGGPLGSADRTIHGGNPLNTDRSDRPSLRRTHFGDVRNGPWLDCCQRERRENGLRDRKITQASLPFRARPMNCLTGSLYFGPAASACLAMAFVISSHPSQRGMRPAFDHGHPELPGLPLPEPIVVSAGRMVTGCRGSSGIQIVPPLDVAGHGPAAGFDLAGCDPAHSWACSANDQSKWCCSGGEHRTAAVAGLFAEFDASMTQLWFRL